MLAGGRVKKKAGGVVVGVRMARRWRVGGHGVAWCRESPAEAVDEGMEVGGRKKEAGRGEGGSPDAVIRHLR